MRSLPSDIYPGSSIPALASDRCAFILAAALLMLLMSNGAFAHTEGHSIPPHIGAHALQHSHAGVAAGHRRNADGHDDSQSDHRKPSSSQRPAISPEQAAQRARKRFGGRVLNVILEQGPGGPYYRVKLLERGRVRVVDIDARR
ncbi:PepSY domain-containing protein [Salinisphaera hydrothermalis]|uniref:PepSY domain-containing protein n=1 Tax=Salinisphaera hydrothermalis (strain C41B8) TaxID=1304275 RepID=A0A084IJB0_SALHC|nr:PepSY domain-containing protein [Salinisphaera hydrothermalis]KEZ76794.1 hypothetical protein C41B8_13145 [Salinisphaera hydrothermalis C41B8]